MAVSTAIISVSHHLILPGLGFSFFIVCCFLGYFAIYNVRIMHLLYPPINFLLEPGHITVRHGR